MAKETLKGLQDRVGALFMKLWPEMSVQIEGGDGTPYKFLGSSIVGGKARLQGPYGEIKEVAASQVISLDEPA